MSKDTAAADQATPTTTDDEGWETISTGLGKEVELAQGESFVGRYVEKVEVDLPEGSERPTATAHIFAAADTGEQRFMWAAHELDTAIVNVVRGQLCRITFEGRDSFTGTDGPRQVKRYKVETRSG